MAGGEAGGEHQAPAPMRKCDIGIYDIKLTRPFVASIGFHGGSTGLIARLIGDVVEFRQRTEAARKDVDQPSAIGPFLI